MPSSLRDSSGSPPQEALSSFGNSQRMRKLAAAGAPLLGETAGGVTVAVGDPVVEGSGEPEEDAGKVAVGVAAAEAVGEALERAGPCGSNAASFPFSMLTYSMSP